MNGRGCTYVRYSYGTGTIVFTQIFSAETVEAEKDSAPDPEYGTGTDFENLKKTVLRIRINIIRIGPGSGYKNLFTWIQIRILNLDLKLAHKENIWRLSSQH